MTERAQEFRDLLSELKRNDGEDPDRFASIFATAHRLLEMSNREMADSLGVSHPSIGRWVKGTAAPHPVMRRAVFIWIETQARERLARVEKRRPVSGSGLSGFPAAAKG